MNLHPMIVHFPIALLITGFLFATIELILKKEYICKNGFSIEPNVIQKTTFYLLFIGSLSAIIAILSGFIFTSDMDSILGQMRKTHYTIAIITTFFSILSTIFYTFYVYKNHSKRLRIIGYIFYLITTILIATTGYFGGEIVYMFR